MIKDSIPQELFFILTKTFLPFKYIIFIFICYFKNCFYLFIILKFKDNVIL